VIPDAVDAGFTPRRAGFNPRLIYVRSVVSIVAALKQDRFQVSSVLPADIHSTIAPY
jgi:hypothetical protein